MPCEPFNKHLLWKSTMELTQTPSKLRQPLMILPNINRLTGKYTEDFPPIRDQLSDKTMNESIAYWKGVEERKILYRLRHSFRTGHSLTATIPEPNSFETLSYTPYKLPL